MSAHPGIHQGAGLALPAGQAQADSAATEVHTSLEVLSELYNYNHWLFNKVRPFVRGRVCEVGSGIGNITQFMLNCEEVCGIEPLRVSYETLTSRFQDHSNVHFAQCVLEQCPRDDVPVDHFDTVVCLNVLEHIEDDVASLRRMRSLCRQKGRVVILVPAFMSLYGELDRSFGHYRRYTRRTLRQAFESAGLRVTYSFYMNTLGVLGWWWQGRCLKRRQITVESSRFFNRLVPFLDAFERVVRLPIGQSLVMIGTPERTDSSR